MTLITCSAIITFYTAFEDQITKFYEDMANNKQYVAGRDTFLLFSKENKKHKENVRRTYYEVITDGLEACYIKSLNEEDYAIKTKLAANTTYSDAIKMAIDVEEKSQKFCTDAYESTKDFMADVSVALRTIAKRKAQRVEILKSLSKAK